MKAPILAAAVFASLSLGAGHGAAQSAQPASGVPQALPPAGGRAPAPPAAAADVKRPPQDIPGWARVSFFANGSNTTSGDGTGTSFSEMIGSIAVQAPVHQDGGLDYGLDVRGAAYPSVGERLNRVSIYNAFAGFQSRGRTFGVKAGQVWLNDLGALGSLGGVVFETRRRQEATRGYVRVGAFGGFEPRILEAGYVGGIRKLGAYLVFEGEGTARRQVVGYVNVRNTGLTERSVVTFSNFLPLKHNNVFIYQAGEYDLAGPAGLGKGGLTYFFTNVRANTGPRIELQGNYHRGRSIDARSVTLDQINGRPIAAKALDGFLFESAGGRVSVMVVKKVRVFGGYAVDRNNAGDPSSRRLQFGVWATDLADTGLDINVTDSRTSSAGATRFDSWYVSVGRTVVPRVYLTGEYSSSLSRLRFASPTVLASGFTLVNSPRTKRYAVSASARVYRPASILITLERIDDPTYGETRILSGLTYRF